MENGTCQPPKNVPDCEGRDARLRSVVEASDDVKSRCLLQNPSVSRGEMEERAADLGLADSYELRTLGLAASVRKRDVWASCTHARSPSRIDL